MEEIARDEEQWEIAVRAQFALHNDRENVYEVLFDRRLSRSKASLCNRLVIETAQYSCPIRDGRAFTEADHLMVLADMAFLISLANHRDAITYGFMDPRIEVLANGELNVDERFYATTLNKYLTKRDRSTSDDAAADYNDHYRQSEPSEMQIAEDEQTLNEFNDIFIPEFGFSIFLLLRAQEEFRSLAARSGQLRSTLTEDDMQSFLHSTGFGPIEAEAFLNRFTLPIRAAWDQNLPKKCHALDVYPWRFRRQLSLNVRPLVQISVMPRAWTISVPVFEKSLKYIINHIDHARFPKEFFHSLEMQRYIDEATNKLGHDFAKRVNLYFEQAGWKSRFELELTELGASKKLPLGDIDVLAWNESLNVVCAVECKRLLTALSVREVVQRLEDFQGRKAEKDSLGRHLRRVDWLKANLSSLTRITGIPSSQIRLIPLLVTSEIVPMQCYDGMNFPVSQVVSFDELPAFLRKYKVQAASIS